MPHGPMSIKQFEKIYKSRAAVFNREEVPMPEEMRSEESRIEEKLDKIIDLLTPSLIITGEEVKREYSKLTRGKENGHSNERAGVRRSRGSGRMDSWFRPQR